MPTGTKDLLAADVCAIIEACGKAGVRIFKQGNLYLALGEAPKIEAVYPMLPVTPLPQAPVGPDHARQNAETLANDEDELRAEQLRMLMIENPMEYERLLRDGELSDEPSESDDDEA